MTYTLKIKALHINPGIESGCYEDELHRPGDSPKVDIKERNGDRVIVKIKRKDLKQ